LANMNIMTQIFPTAASFAKMKTMQDLRVWLETNGPAYLLQALRTLETNTAGEPLKLIPADLAWIDTHFPKSRDGKHPRPDLGQSLEAYKKWRADLVRAVKKASGAEAEKTERRTRRDAWADLFQAGKLHTSSPGIVHAAALSPLNDLADIARRAELEPWDLADDDVLRRLEDAFVKQDDLQSARRAQKFLNSYAFIPEIAELLPKKPVHVFPTLRQYQSLPTHIDAVLIEMVNRASVQADKVARKDSQTVKDCTRGHYLAALRHHIRMLPKCPPDPACDYSQPIADLTAVNDVYGLFSEEHLSATIRQTQAVEHLPGTLSQASAYDYYSEILIILARNGMQSDETYQALKSSTFLQQGKELGKGMTQATKDWCEALLEDPGRERRFTNMHRILMGHAEKIFSKADAERRPLSKKERTKARQLGTCAAACAVEWSGRPIRLSNLVGLRLRGSRRNFFTPTTARPEHSFRLFADETKSGQPEELTPLRKELYGPQVLAWYLSKIRPLFAHAEDSIYLFPAVDTPGEALGCGTFDKWFQRAAASAGLPMTFHRWRHGYATLLLDTNWNNLQVAADMLGNTPAVCARSYAWLDKSKLIKAGQEEQIKRARARQ